MNKKSHFLLLSSLALMALSSCGGGQAPGSSTESSVESDPDDGKTVSVFVLSGQSNMEGSTFYDNGHDYLRAAGEALEVDVEPAFEGIEGVQTSFYGYYPYQGWGQDAWKNITPHCSNTENPLDGKFEATKVGMGNRDDLMGPEVGLSLGLKDHRKNSRPIFFIKCAFSGSGFTSQNPTWKTHEQGTEDQLFDRLLLYTHNNLGLIEDMGYKPVIKGFLWHQGEHDAFENTQFSYDERYEYYYSNLLKQFLGFREYYKKFDFPIITGGLCRDWKKRYMIQSEAVEKATIDVCKKIEKASFVPASDLPSNEEAIHNGDLDHFSKESILILGERYFDAFEALKPKAIIISNE